MSAPAIFRQCRLVKKIAGGESVQMSWIPKRFARLGNVVRISGDDGRWDEGWTVSELGSELSEEMLDRFNLFVRRLRREPHK